jgi:hypothetical protein
MIIDALRYTMRRPRGFLPEEPSRGRAVPQLLSTESLRPFFCDAVEILFPAQVKLVSNDRWRG